MISMMCFDMIFNIIHVYIFILTFRTFIFIFVEPDWRIHMQDFSTSTKHHLESFYSLVSPIKTITCAARAVGVSNNVSQPLHGNPFPDMVTIMPEMESCPQVPQGSPSICCSCGRRRTFRRWMQGKQHQERDCHDPQL